MLNLRHSFLVSSSSHLPLPYQGSVIYICEHNFHGSLGLIINKKTDLSLSDFIKKHPQKKSSIDIMLGGPQESHEKGFILHRNTNNFWLGTTQLSKNLFLTSSEDILDDLDHYNAKDFRYYLGYCTWLPGQLEEEFINDLWFHLPYQDSLIFHPTPPMIRTLCFEFLGFNPHQFQKLTSNLV